MEGKVLKKLREEAKKTQKQVAEELGYHTTTYARWEQDLCNMKLIDVINIAMYFGVSIDYIAGLTENPKPNTKKKQKNSTNQKEKTTEEEQRLIEAYEKLTDEGKKAILTTAELYAQSPQYQKYTDISNET